MKKYYPSKISLNILKVLGFIISIVITILSTKYLVAYKIIMWITIIIFWLSYILVLLIAFPIYFKRTTYCISSSEVSKQSGIIYLTRQLMRTKSIQYYTLFSTPLSKYTGFNFIIFNALGGRVIFLFLSDNDASEITSTISAIIRQNKN